MGKNQQHKAAQRGRHGDGEDGQPDLGTGKASNSRTQSSVNLQMT